MWSGIDGRSTVLRIYMRVTWLKECVEDLGGG